MTDAAYPYGNSSTAGNPLTQPLTDAGLPVPEEVERYAKSANPHRREMTGWVPIADADAAIAALVKVVVGIAAELERVQSYGGILQRLDQFYPLDVAYFAESDDPGCQAMRAARQAMLASKRAEAAEAERDRAIDELVWWTDFWREALAVVLLSYGDLQAERDRLKTLLDAEGRFWAKVRRGGDDECWVWVGANKGNERPYGMFWLGGRSRPAAQVAWEIHYGDPFPSGMDACHRCDNPACVNPQHIFPGTPSDNAKDAQVKGRLYNPEVEKTHCPAGHPYSGSNLRLTKSGYRICRACENERHRRYRASQHKEPTP